MDSSMTVTKLSVPNTPCIHRYYDVPCESPDGRRILYFAFDGSVPGPGSVIVADHDGGDPETAARAEGDCIGHVGAQCTWLDDGTIAFAPGGDGKTTTRILSLEDGSSRDVDGSIRSFHAPTRRAALLLCDPKSDAGEFSRQRRALLELLDMQSGERRTLLRIRQAIGVHPQRDRIDPATMNFQNCKFSPDGRTLSVVFTNMIYRKQFGPDGVLPVKSLVLVDTDGTDVRYLGEFGHHPMWAPDGSYILAQNRASGENGQDLVAYPADGSEPYPLLRDFTGVHTSLDSAMARVVTDAYNCPRTGRASVLLYDLASRKADKIAEGAQTDVDHTTGCHVHPQWSRDESRILFNMSDSGSPALYALDL